eukprot:GHVS01011684.1.p1 GENE.GHVS01011684.1~~GHVS01011684.1.p1  ORF type:complete len:570 (+),score=82.84 GHVS01011684.1:175-1884(+)
MTSLILVLQVLLLSGVIQFAVGKLALPFLDLADEGRFDPEEEGKDVVEISLKSAWKIDGYRDVNKLRVMFPVPPFFEREENASAKIINTLAGYKLHRDGDEERMEKSKHVKLEVGKNVYEAAFGVGLFPAFAKVKVPNKQVEGGERVGLVTPVMHNAKTLYKELGIIEGRLVSLLRLIISPLMWMHDHEMAHGDVKSSNYLLVELAEEEEELGTVSSAEDSTSSTSVAENVRSLKVLLTGFGNTYVKGDESVVVANPAYSGLPDVEVNSKVDAYGVALWLQSMGVRDKEEVEMMWDKSVKGLGDKASYSKDIGGMMLFLLAGRSPIGLLPIHIEDKTGDKYWPRGDKAKLEAFWCWTSILFEEGRWDLKEASKLLDSSDSSEEEADDEISILEEKKRGSSMSVANEVQKMNKAMINSELSTFKECKGHECWVSSVVCIMDKLENGERKKLLKVKSQAKGFAMCAEIWNDLKEKNILYCMKKRNVAKKIKEALGIAFTVNYLYGRYLKAPPQQEVVVTENEKINWEKEVEKVLKEEKKQFKDDKKQFKDDKLRRELLGQYLKVTVATRKP